MSTVATDHPTAFAVWLTGLPASGKSTLVSALKAQLESRDMRPAVLESDSMRKVLTPHPSYDDAERDRFYSQLVFIAQLLTSHGVPVILDATANRQRYRDAARQVIPNFLEVYLDTPLETCINRDPKGIYRSALNGGPDKVPGLQAAYEVPAHPELILNGSRETPESGARQIIDALAARGYLPVKA